MESEGRSPLRILRHALIIAEVLTTVLFLPTKNLSAAKYLQEKGTNPASIGFRESMSTLGRSSHRESTANRFLTIGNTVCVELREPGEMDLPRVPLGQSDHSDDSARKRT